MQTLHPFFNFGELFKTKLFIEAVCVIGGKQPTADEFQVRVFEHGLHQPLAQAMPAKILMDKDIAKIGDNDCVGYYPRHAYLMAAFIDAEDQ